MDRRKFISSAAAFSAARALGANDRIRFALIGCGGRGSFIAGLAKSNPNTELVAACDINEPRLLVAVKKFGAPCAGIADYRRVLDNKEIDAVVIGTPDHWHVPMTIAAVEAGKDVYVEKPVSHTIEEGERVEKVVTASKQIVQVGYQQRSWEHFLAAREIVADGKLGQVTLVLTSWYQDYLSGMKVKPVVDPAKVDWKAFLGSAPDQPFDALRCIKWRWFWDFGGGHLTDLYSHYGDVVQWYMGSTAVLAVQSIGGRNAIPQFECPDTINTAWQYPGFQIVYDGALNGSLDGGNIIFRGSHATMKINRDGFGVYPEGLVKRELTHWPEPETSMKSAHDGSIDHVKNWLDCIRTRKAPNAGIATSVAIAKAAHLGNAAYRKA
jgi:predicted dehydrogenase